jgi:hypothetical protein
MTTFLNISLALESTEPLDQLCSDLHERLEYLLEEDKCKVFSVSWDRDQALAFLQAQNGVPHINLSPEPAPLASDVAAVLARFNLTLPKQKKGAPPWRTPKKKCIGNVQGLPNLRGELVLTNGIQAYIVQDVEQATVKLGRCKWAEVHYDWFLPDDLSAMPDIEPRKVKETKSNINFDDLCE